MASANSQGHRMADSTHIILHTYARETYVYYSNIFVPFPTLLILMIEMYVITLRLPAASCQRECVHRVQTQCPNSPQSAQFCVCLNFLSLLPSSPVSPGRGDVNSTWAYPLGCRDAGMPGDNLNPGIKRAKMLDWHSRNHARNAAAPW